MNVSNIDLKKIDLNLLVVFDLLMQERSVSKAAERLFLSQPAMSYSLKRLRDSLNDDILIRDKNEMIPTYHALKLEQPIRRLLQELEYNLNAPEEFDPSNSSKTFTISSSEYFECMIAPSLIEYINEVAPNIKIVLNILVDTLEEDNDLRSGELDLIIGIDNNLSQRSYLSHTTWFHEKLVCIARKSNLIENTLNKEVLSQQQYVQDSLIRTMSVIDTWFTKNNLTKNIVTQVESYTAVVRVIEKTEYVAILPRRAAVSFQNFADIKLIELPHCFPEFNLTMNWHPIRNNDPELIWLMNAIKHVSKMI